MSELEARFQRQMEDVLERPLTADELRSVGGLGQLSDAQVAVARKLAAGNLALCAMYLCAVAPVAAGEAKQFMDRVLGALG